MGFLHCDPSTLECKKCVMRFLSRMEIHHTEGKFIDNDAAMNS